MRSGVGGGWRVLMIASAVAICAASTAAHAQDAADLPFDVDWSVGLRGAYEVNRTGSDLAALVSPELTLSRESDSNSANFATGGTFALRGPDVDINDLHLRGDSTLELNPEASLRGTADVALTRSSIIGSTTLPTDTLDAPLVLDGSLEGSAMRRFGRFDLTGTLRGARHSEGATTLNNGTSVDNSAANYWLGSTTLRVGYEVTPLATVFVEGEQARSVYDPSSTTGGANLDNVTRTLRGGISYTFGTILTAEASLGRQWLDYSNDGYASASGWVYDTSVTFNPNETLALNADLSTTLEPSTSTVGDTAIGYEMSASAKYTVNPWLSLRGSAAWSQSTLVAAGTPDTGYTLGAGLDFIRSRHVTWSADYTFEHDDPTTSAPTDTHQVSVGVKIRR